VLWDNGDYGFSKCPSCGLIYQYPRPKQEQLVSRYDREYFAYELENERGFFGLMKKALADVRFFEEIETSVGAGRFLDVGCATGMLLAEMKRRGWNEKGVEVCAPSAEYGRRERGVDIHTGTLEEASFSGESFDVVHASHLIEHLTEPEGFLRELFRLLKPGGWAIITTPNAAGLQARLFGGGWRSAIADHMYLFSRATLTALMRKSGFEIERWKTWGGIAAGLAPGPIKRLVDASAKRFGFGDVMVIRARKPGA
jgi:2-polyprenyl-3-methyl-5-hydroxy-6-metoxy-1,4-benzoquinol methylase